MRKRTGWKSIPYAMEELICLIEVVTPEMAKEKDKAILGFFGTYEHGIETATAKICSVFTN